MARNSRRKRTTASGITRHTPPYRKSLGHTVSPRSLSSFEPVSLADIREAFSRLRPVRSPLIRTVLVDSSYQPPPRHRGSPRSPTVQVRATGRSSDVKLRSPFLNAQTITPELTERAIICAKRTIRREVLFASKKTGKGAKSPRKPQSKVRC